MKTQNDTQEARHKVRETVRAGYAQIAQHGSERRKSSCCGGMTVLDASVLAQKVGYMEEELTALPEGANIGLSCGNPGALAALRPGEVLLDLGSGAGFDTFIAGPKVGSTGRVIGVDMTPEMLARARLRAISGRAKLGPPCLGEREGMTCKTFTNKTEILKAES